MSQRAVKQLNKLAKLLDLSRDERTKLKLDWHKTPNRSIQELKDRIARMETTNELILGSKDGTTA